MARLLPVLLLVGLAACGGRHTYLTPLGSVEIEPVPDESAAASVQAVVPVGMTLELGSEPGEGATESPVVHPASSSINSASSPPPPDPVTVETLSRSWTAGQSPHPPSA